MSGGSGAAPRIEKLSSEHVIAEFDCGSEPLNRFLKTFALNNQASGSATTYLALSGDVVAGYYSLSVGSIIFDDAPERLKKGLAQHPVPIMLMGRLGVDKSQSGNGLGKGLLLDALRRTVQVADIASLRAIVVHAKDEPAKTFYEHFGYTAVPSKPLTLYALLKDVRKMIG